MVKKAKVIFLGDTAVGKSCIISAINGHPFSSMHQPTIGMDFSTKMCNGSTNQYKLQLWDTAGQQKFRSIMPSYIRNSKIAILVYDVTSIKTFANLEKWIEMFQQCGSQTSRLIVIGNKIDLYHDRKVSMQKVQEKVQKFDLKYLQISAKTREGINELVEQILIDLQQMTIPDQHSSQNQENTKLKSGGSGQKCCGKS